MIAPPATAADIDLPATHQLADDVRATLRLVRVVEGLIGEVLDRAATLERRVNDLDPDDPFDSPSRMDLILDRANPGDIRRALLDVADRICEEVDEEPPTVRVRWWRAINHLAKAHELPVKAIFDAFEATEAKAPDHGGLADEQEHER